MSTTLIIMLVTFFIIMLLGMPISFSIGASAIIALVCDGGMSAMIVPQRMFVMMDSFSLMAIPLFVLAGELMSTAGITQRIVRFASSLMGHLRGGLAHVTILASMLMAGISGSASADTAALGGILIPAMKDEGYDGDMAACVVASGGIIGPIIPPSIMMVLFASITAASVGDMFLGGLIPGILMGLSVMAYVSFSCKKRGFQTKPKASWSERGRAFVYAIPALMMPVIILGGILSGIFTATEAGAVACLYALVFGLVTKNITKDNIYELFKNGVSGTVIPMFIIGIAAIFGWVMTRYNLHIVVANFILGLTQNPNVFIVIVMIVYLFLGCFMEANAGMLIMTPILFPIAQQLGFSPVHFGVITVVNFCIGSITPPVGLQLFIAGSIAKEPMSKLAKTVWPYVLMLIIVLFISALFPDVVMLLPSLFGSAA